MESLYRYLEKADLITNVYFVDTRFEYLEPVIISHFMDLHRELQKDIEGASLVLSPLVGTLSSSVENAGFRKGAEWALQRSIIKYLKDAK